MGFFNQLFSPKRQRIIENVRSYYNGKTSHISYSSREIKETIAWVKKSNLDQKEMLIEKLTMAELIARKKETSK